MNGGAPGSALESHYRFLLWLVPIAERFPRSQKFLLGGRIQGTALDVLEELATWQPSDRLAQADPGIEKLRFLLAHDLRCLDSRRYEHAARGLGSRTLRRAAQRRIVTASPLPGFRQAARPAPLVRVCSEGFRARSLSSAPVFFPAACPCPEMPSRIARRP